MHRALVTGLVAVLSVITSAAQSTRLVPKAAWDWTIDERIAQRFDRDRIQERTLAYKPAVNNVRSDSMTAASDATDSKASLSYVIDGGRNPELFLPHELYDMLLSGLTPDESLRSKQQGFYRASLRKLGYDDTAFWNALASVSGAYLPVRFGSQQSSFFSAKGGRVAVDARCSARFDALEAARRLFGHAEFDRVLYTVVAPTMMKSSATYDPHPEEALRRAEEGCR
jgi:hypothetical protein